MDDKIRLQKNSYGCDFLIFLFPRYTKRGRPSKSDQAAREAAMAKAATEVVSSMPGADLTLTQASSQVTTAALPGGIRPMSQSLAAGVS